MLMLPSLIGIDFTPRALCTFFSLWITYTEAGKTSLHQRHGLLPDACRWEAGQPRSIPEEHQHRQRVDDERKLVFEKRTPRQRVRWGCQEPYRRSR